MGGRRGLGFLSFMKKTQEIIHQLKPWCYWFGILFSQNFHKYKTHSNLFSTTENILNFMIIISDFFRWLYHWKTDLSWCIPVPSCLCLVQHKCHTDTLASTEGGHTRLACCPRPEARQGDPTRPTTKKGPPTAACIDPNTSMGTTWPTLTLLQMVHFTSLLVCPQLHTHASQLRQL